MATSAPGQLRRQACRGVGPSSLLGLACLLLLPPLLVIKVRHGTSRCDACPFAILLLSEGRRYLSSGVLASTGQSSYPPPMPWCPRVRGLGHPSHACTSKHCCSGRNLVRLSDSLFFAPQSDSEKKKNAIRKSSARNDQIRGLFGSLP
jgi:hypothetical protein